MIERLHYITQDMIGKTHVQLAEEACSLKARWVQLRLKGRPDEELKNIAIETLAVCRKYNAKLIINDHVRIAEEIGADGIHLGKQDMSTAEARKILGKKFIIGGTANTFEDIEMHAAAGVDYIGLGPLRYTNTKENLSPVLGIEGYRHVMQQCEKKNISIPVIAIGGVRVSDTHELKQAGVYGIAVAGYINHAENKQEVIKEFLSRVEEEKLKTY
ncbi:MAG TPA: thiamine phosphate synthase [Bacteroidia bacterium]|jgi:thiamine-phosphate pyrophosphorylase|nr:thiamine phosphate synthase [Bacteroidia bacterium]